jgi:hypothetical protein
MNGFITKTVGGLALGAGLSFLAGCMGYRTIVDPCWPQRYNQMARDSIRDATNAQANNGHILDQTIWDYFFVRDRDGRPTEVLNDAGLDHLHYLARRRPCPDLHVFLQTADVPYVPGAADKVVAARVELNQKRIAAIQAYMATVLTPCGITAPVEVAVFDPALPGQMAIGPGGSLPPGRDLPIQGSLQKNQQQYQGILPYQLIGGAISAGGGSGSGGGGGGSGGGGSSGGGGGGR